MILENLRNRLSQALADYFQDMHDLDTNKLTDYLMENIDELKELKRTVGSKVRIKSDLIPEHLYGGVGFESDMLQYLGKEATITYHNYEEDCVPSYLLDIDDSFWSWSEEMLEDQE